MSRYYVNQALRELVASGSLERVQDGREHLGDFPLSDSERRAILEPRWSELLALGALPNLVYRYFAFWRLPAEEFVRVAGGRQEEGE